MTIATSAAVATNISITSTQCKDPSHNNVQNTTLSHSTNRVLSKMHITKDLLMRMWLDLIKNESRAVDDWINTKAYKTQ